MIPPRDQWCIQIEITNRCTRRCSNCTRLLAHANEYFDMDPAFFRRAVEILKPFTDQGPDRQSRRRCLGMMGGEPLLHPQFAQLVDIFCEVVPDPGSRGLWTGLDWPNHRYAAACKKLFGGMPSMHVGQERQHGYLNWNQHGDAHGEAPSRHQSPLVAICDVVPYSQEMWRLIDQCWVQEHWSSAVTPKGFFFCEIAAAFDWVFEGPGGLPLEEGVWQRPLSDFKEQIQQWCPRCGMARWDQKANRMHGPEPREDREGIDDISRSNLAELKAFGSPRVLCGQYVCVGGDKTDCACRAPWRYRG